MKKTKLVYMIRSRRNRFVKRRDEAQNKVEEDLFVVKVDEQ